MTFTLHPLPGDDRFYCGPAAIAAFTGKHPKKEIRTAINRYRNRPASQGVCRMFNRELVGVLRMLGLGVTDPVWQPNDRTLQAFVKARPFFCGVVNVTGHYVAVANGMALDNKSLIARPIDQFPGRRKMVRYFMLVYKAD